ncbi:MAG: helix-turn-helix domain-containing protein [Spirochaetia bacterium]|nr:helix-turn-helix domain-containing protein [Spirochaetia bacterium]MBR0318040.1 helix-turn-helix domain-containing protein [Spirochaetia bacterium]
MFHKAIDIKFLRGTTLKVVFLDGTVKKYDMSLLFHKYPQLAALNNRKLFLSGRLSGPYGIIWNDDLDIETETIYAEGKTVQKKDIQIHMISAKAVLSARALAGISQAELSSASGINQSDISKIERGVANPSVRTLERIAAALGGQLSIAIQMPPPAPSHVQ